MSLTLKMQFFKHSGLMKNLRKVLLIGKSKQCCLLSKILSKTSCVKRSNGLLIHKIASPLLTRVVSIY